MILTLERSPMVFETFDNIAIKLFYNEKTNEFMQLYHIANIDYFISSEADEAIMI